jgi:hypothetical protein
VTNLFYATSKTEQFYAEHSEAILNAVESAESAQMERIGLDVKSLFF